MSERHISHWTPLGVKCSCGSYMQPDRPCPKAERVYGMCLSCRAVEVEIYDVIGYRDLSHIGEHPRYPVGYGCEVCS